MKTRAHPPKALQTTIRAMAALALFTFALNGTACRRISQLALSPFKKSASPAPRQPKRSFRLLPSWPSWPSWSVNPVIRQSLAAYGGKEAWKAREGVELEMVWKTFEGTRTVDDPALVQMVTGSPTQIRIHFSKLDQVFALGDAGPWVMLNGKPDDSPEFVARSHYTAATMAFFLSLPFSLTDPGVVIHETEAKTWGGDTFDVVTVGFRGSNYPWHDDTLALWFRRPSFLLDRCYFVSTASGSAFGPPPNYIWILWQEPTQLNGLQLARRWSFLRSDTTGAMKEKMFDIEVANAVPNRSFLPVLFRKPIIEPLVGPRPLIIPGTTPTPTPAVPQP